MPIQKTKFTVSKNGELLVKEEVSMFTGKQHFKLYDRRSGDLKDYYEKEWLIINIDY